MVSDIAMNKQGVISSEDKKHIKDRLFVIGEFYKQLAECRTRLTRYLLKSRLFVLNGDYGMVIHLKDKMFRPISSLSLTTNNTFKAKDIIDEIVGVPQVPTEYDYVGKPVCNKGELIFTLKAHYDDYNHGDYTFGGYHNVSFDETIPIHITKGHIYKSMLLEIPTVYCQKETYKGYVAPLEGIIASKLYNVAVGIENHAETASYFSEDQLKDLYDLSFLLKGDYDEEAMLLALKKIMQHYGKNVYESPFNLFDTVFINIHNRIYSSMINNNYFPNIPLEEVVSEAPQKIKESMTKGMKRHPYKA